MEIVAFLLLLILWALFIIWCKLRCLHKDIKVANEQIGLMKTLLKESEPQVCPTSEVAVIPIKDTDEKHMTIVEKMFKLFCEHDIEIYTWKRECWKCKKSTPLYSYFLTYNANTLMNGNGILEVWGHNVGIGYVPSLDKYLSQKYPTIKSMYSRAAEERYIANICQHCGALQGRDYVSDDPHEIAEFLNVKGSMTGCVCGKIKVNDTTLTIEELREHYWALEQM